MSPFLISGGHYLERKDNVNILTSKFLKIFQMRRLLFVGKCCIV